MKDLLEFVTSELPPPPARVLEVGCGPDGALARGLVDAGYDVVAIDPRAPDGPPFQRVSLEDFSFSEPFDAIVASLSLHHIPNLHAAVAKLAAMLKSGGVLVLNEFAWDRLDRETAAWFYTQRRVLASRGGPAAPETIKQLEDDWAAEHEGLHGHEAMQAALESAFTERSFEWVPYLYRFVEGLEDVRDDEQKLIEGGGIRAVGFRYVGLRRN